MLFRSVHPIRGMETPYHYRNKVISTFAAGQGGKLVSGIYAAGTHKVLPVERCLLEDEVLDTAMEAVRDEETASARKALAAGSERCDQMREHMNHLLRTDVFTELEACLKAADGYLERDAPEEAFGELRRAQVQVETMEWLSRRIL